MDLNGAMELEDGSLSTWSTKNLVLVGLNCIRDIIEQVPVGEDEVISKSFFCVLIPRAPKYKQCIACLGLVYALGMWVKHGKTIINKPSPSHHHF